MRIWCLTLTRRQIRTEIFRVSLLSLSVCPYDSGLAHIGPWRLRSVSMVESHERISRRIIRWFGSFPTKTYSNRIVCDMNGRFLFIYGELSECVHNVYRHDTIRRCTLVNILSCDRGIWGLQCLALWIPIIIMISYRVYRLLEVSSIDKAILKYLSSST